jgi:photosystem II stability/assembly factor-like uncharacterized protein
LKTLLFFFLAAFLLPVNSQAGWVLQHSPVTTHLFHVNFHHGNENIAWTCGENGVILHTTNGGANWVQQVTGTTNDLYAVVYMETAGGPVIAVGENGTILRTTNFGANWTLIPSPVTQTLRDVSDFNFYAVGDSGVIIRSTNAGLNWVSVTSPTTKNLNAIAATFSYYAVGDDGTVLMPQGGAGSPWVVLASGMANRLRGVPLFGSRNIVAGANGLVAKSTNFGVNWITTPTNTTKSLNALEFSVNNNDRIYCVGDSGVILRSTNFAATWGFQNSGTTNNLNPTFFYLGDNTGYAVGNNGTILKTTDAGGAVTYIREENGNTPGGFALYQNYPNPFNPATDFGFRIAGFGFVTLKIYNSQGKEIAVLISEDMNAGVYEYTWNASAFSSGVYYYRLEAGEFSETKKMVLVK